MATEQRTGDQGVPPADCGLAKKFLRPATSHQQRGWQQPQPNEGKDRRPPLAPEGSISPLSVAEQLRALAGKEP